MSYVRRRLFRFKHPDAGPIMCRVVVGPDMLNALTAYDMSAHIMRRVLKFFDITSPKDVQIVDSRDLADGEDEDGNC